MRKTLQVIAMGGGYFAQFHLEAWQRLPQTELAAIVELDADRQSELKTLYPNTLITGSLSVATSEIDADIVDIITPPATHQQLIDSALNQAQRAIIICQKPFCASLSVANQVVEKAHNLGRTVVVHENFRFQPWYTKIKSILETGSLGQTLQLTFKLRPGDGQGCSAYLDRQPYFRQMERFLIHETGIHWVDVFRYLLGEPHAVSADLRRINPEIAGEDAGYFIFHYDHALRAQFDGNRLLDHSANNTRHTMGEMIIEGSKATLYLNGDGEITLRKFDSTQITNVSYDFNAVGFGADCVFLLQAHVANHLINGTPLHNTAADYIKNLHLEENIYQAAKSHSLITLSQR